MGMVLVTVEIYNFWKFDSKDVTVTKSGVVFPFGNIAQYLRGYETA